MALDLDFLTQVINVRWGGEFIYVGGQEEVARQPFAQTGWSSDGYAWTKTNNIMLGKNAIFIVSVSGSISNGENKRDCIFAAGYAVDTIILPSGIPSAKNYPIAALSFDQGKNWQNSNLPRLDTGQSSAPAIGYHADSEAFYAGALYSPQPDWLLVLYKYKNSWSEVSRITVSIDEVDEAGYPVLGYPEDINLNDRLIVQQSAKGIIVRTRPDIKYCSCNGPGQIMHTTDTAGNELTLNMNNLGTLLINGKASTKRGFSACAGNGLVAAVIFDNGLHVIVSSDAGESWKSTLDFPSAIPGTIAFAA